MKYDLETIKQNLSTNQQWVERAIIRLYEFQTADEKRAEQTKHTNGKGFNSSDARALSYFAQWLQKGKRLSGKHLEKAHRMVPKYAKQIQSLIEQ